MKSLLIISARGSAGGTTLTCLLAHLQCTRHWRVLILDLAEPPCCAYLIVRCRFGAIVSGNRTPLPHKSAQSASDGCVRVLNADAIDGLQSRDDPARTRYYANLRQLLSVVAQWFNVCLVDAPALPDVRVVCAEALVDAVLSPVAVSPGCVDCASEVINGAYGIRNIRAQLNPALRFTGILLVAATTAAMEEAWAKVMQTTLHEWLIADPVSSHGYVYLPCLRSASRVECLAMADGVSPEGDAATPEDGRALAVCLNVLTHGLDPIRDIARPSDRHAEVCDA